MSTPSQIVSSLQTIHAAVAGVEAAPTELRGIWDSVDMPLVWTHPGPTPEFGGWFGGDDLITLDRFYIVRCFAQPIGQGEGIDQGYQLALTLLPLFGAAYQADPNLGGTVSHIRSAQDTGITLLEYGGNQYHGFEFRLLIRDKTT